MWSWDEPPEEATRFRVQKYNEIMECMQGMEAWHAQEEYGVKLPGLFMASYTVRDSN